jgi:hypothetical protein
MKKAIQIKFLTGIGMDAVLFGLRDEPEHSNTINTFSEKEEKQGWVFLF